MHAGDPAVHDERGGVVERSAADLLISRDEPDDGRQLQPTRQTVQRAQALLDEAGLLDEVARRIAHQGQFGEERKRCALRRGPLCGVRNLTRIPPEVTEGRIDLRQGDLHPRTFLKAS